MTKRCSTNFGIFVVVTFPIRPNLTSTADITLQIKTLIVIYVFVVCQIQTTKLHCAWYVFLSVYNSIWCEFQYLPPLTRPATLNSNPLPLHLQMLFHSQISIINIIPLLLIMNTIIITIIVNKMLILLSVCESYSICNHKCCKQKHFHYHCHH